MTFVDTNILVYSLLAEQAPAKHAIAVSLLAEGGFLISTQVVNEMASVLRSKAKISERELLRIVEDLFSLFDVVESNSDDILTAFDLRARYNFSYWDSLMVATALRSGADDFLTEDLQDGLVIDDPLMIRNPFA